MKATSIRFSSPKVMPTTDTPGDEVDLMCSMPGTLLIELSIRPVTLASTMSGLAPFIAVVTDTIGNSISGKRSIPTR